MLLALACGKMLPLQSFMYYYVIDSLNIFNIFNNLENKVIHCVGVHIFIMGIKHKTHFNFFL